MYLHIAYADHIVLYIGFVNEGFATSVMNGAERVAKSKQF
jgi:hypothetical protein